ncbi:MAG: hypothetical protein ACMXX5_00980 [Candidatus Woesearchaeota archaeon]
MYTSIRSLYAQAKENGSVMPEMAQQAATITYALDEKLNDENYSPSEDIVAQANMTKKIADKILSLYTAGVKRQNGI